MRVAAASLAALLAGCTHAVAASSGPAPVLHPLEAALVYHAQAEAPPPPELAAAFGEICGERDEAARRQAIAEAGPRLAQAQREAGGTLRWVVPLRQKLGGYDLRRGGFPVGLHTGGAIRFDKFDYCEQPLAYLVAFENGDDFDFLPVPDPEARQFIRSNRERAAELELTVEPVRARPGPPAPTLVVRIERVRLKDALSGATLGELPAR